MHLIIPAFVVALLIGGLSINQILGLYQLENTPQQTALSEQETSKILTALEKQMSTVKQIKEKYSNYTVDVDALTQKLGELEAETYRLRALGVRVVKMAKLDSEEFNFDIKPGRGGASEQGNTDDISTAAELMRSIAHLDKVLSSEQQMMAGMSKIVQGRLLDEEVKPSGKPVAQGYVSSSYGYRRDPFNGRSRLHKGVDFAAKTGTQIYSVAVGVVSFVGRKGGYGNAVEVDHGNGLVSRYGHLSKPKVAMGALVKKGDLIALSGSTGRSTGPHLHLEILQDGKQIDPSKYLSQFLKKK
jgi:murein DD-endopeptidase MepM/ murein hydrolase activator NlpD